MTQALTTKKDRAGNVKALLERYQPQMAQALPRHLNPDRVMRIVTTSILRTPALLNCDQGSLIGAVLEATSLGLIPDGVQGHAYLVPYGKTCTLIPGYKGLISLARQSGEISTLTAEVVHENDEFEVRLGTDQELHHVPNFRSARGEIIAIYAAALLKDGGRQFVVMTKDEVEAIRSRSKSGRSGPWATDWSEMAKKTAIRRLCKLLPTATEDSRRLQRAADLDERAERGIPQEIELPEFDARADADCEVTTPEPEVPETPTN